MKIIYLKLVKNSNRIILMKNIKDDILLKIRNCLENLILNTNIKTDVNKLVK